MPLASRNSLHLRLWLVIALALVPVFLLVLTDYRNQRVAAISQLELDVSQLLAAARAEQRYAFGTVRLVLEIMARSDDLRNFDPEDCNGLARRLQRSIGDFPNLGAALPDGTVVCSAQSMSGVVNVSDRRWFQRAIAGGEVTSGEFVIGRISGQPGMVFSYPLLDEKGMIRLMLFASSGLDWFSSLVDGFDKPEGWEASLISADGLLLSNYRNLESANGQTVSAPVLTAIRAALSRGDALAEIIGPDGETRLYGIEALSFSDQQILMLVSAPVGRTLSTVDQAFQLRLVMLIAILLGSALVARFYIYKLIEVWAERLRKTLDRIASGSLNTRISEFSQASELASVEQGINLMATELERREAESRRLSTAIEQSPECVVITDTEARIDYVNDAFVRTTGYTREEVIGKNPNILNRGKTPREVFDDLWRTLGRGDVWRGEFHNTRKDGAEYVELATIAPIKQPDGRVTHYVAVKEDITLRKRAEERLHHLAYYDTLTGLANRSLLRDRLGQVVLASARSRTYGMLLLVDIDRFKLLNDSQGHEAGDDLLRKTADRLQHAVRQEDTVARQGDDDFAVVIEDIGKDEASAIARAEAIARKLHDDLAQPYDLVGQPVSHIATQSIGITLFCDSGIGVEDLLKQAEVALYQAKEDGRNAIRFYNPAMQAVVDMRATMERGLRDALATGGFQLYYQPQVNKAGQVIGAEALIRWLGADGNMVSPAEFIPLAEETGLIVQIGQWVVDTACVQLRRWQDAPATRHLTIAVNVSAKQFRQPDFVAQLGASITRHGIDASGLKLELTESVILGEVEDTIQRMQQLRTLGIRFALDDFGTGYSSLSYLRRLPIDQLKIDQSFVRDMINDASSQAIVRAILAMSGSLAIEVIAEGVETLSQRDLLLENGCILFQGYLFGRPMPLAEWSPNLSA